MKRFILGIIAGGIIFGSSVYALSNYFYNANEITYMPDDQTWSVSSVSKALDDLRDKAKNYIPKPTETKSITSNGSNIDVTNYAKVNVNVKGAAIYLGEYTANTTIDVSNLGATSADQFIAVCDTSGGSYKHIGYNSVNYANGYGTYQAPTMSYSSNTLTLNVGRIVTTISSNGSGEISGNGNVALSTKVYYVGNINTQ